VAKFAILTPLSFLFRPFMWPYVVPKHVDFTVFIYINFYLFTCIC